MAGTLSDDKLCDRIAAIRDDLDDLLDELERAAEEGDLLVEPERGRLRRTDRRNG